MCIVCFALWFAELNRAVWKPKGQLLRLTK